MSIWLPFQKFWLALLDLSKSTIMHLIIGHNGILPGHSPSSQWPVPSMYVSISTSSTCITLLVYLEGKFMKWNLSFAMEWVFCFLKCIATLLHSFPPDIHWVYISQAKMKKEIFATIATICRVMPLDPARCSWHRAPQLHLGRALQGVLDISAPQLHLGWAPQGVLDISAPQLHLGWAPQGVLDISAPQLHLGRALIPETPHSWGITIHIKSSPSLSSQ